MSEPSRPEPASVSGARYQQILDTAPDAMVVIDATGTISFANRQTETLFGHPREELSGKPLDLLIPNRFRHAHAGHIETYFAKPTVRHMGSGLGLFGRRADGTEMDIEVSLSPVRTGNTLLVCAAIRDISERRRIEAMVKLAADRLASAVESIQDAFALFDSDDRLVQCNSVYRALFGVRLGDLVGRSYSAIMTSFAEELDFASDVERASFVLARTSTRSAPTATYDVRTRDGFAFRVNDRRTAEGGVVTIVWDLTDDERRAEELRRARTQAEAGSAAKSEFLSSMSHELRTPMNAILGFAQLLRRDKKEPLSVRHRERVDHILKGGEHLLRLIDDILDLSRIEAGGLSVSAEPVDVRLVIDEVMTTIEPAASRVSVQIVRPTWTGASSEVIVDRTRFAQILMNFGSNAVKYNRPGGTVSFDLARTSDERVRISVTDTGMGIPEDKQDKIFQPFQRAGQETGPIEGTGIGLAISKRLAGLLGAEVGFSSMPGQGSTFWIEMPARLDESHAPRPDPSEAAALEGKERRGVVLYVEDNPANVLFMQDLVSSYDDVELLVAPTAEMGVQLARARRPHVVLMDINLPGMSGLEALRILKEWPETTTIPVIALTAAASDRDRQRGERAGFFRYLTKPLKVDELDAALDEVLPR